MNALEHLKSAIAELDEAYDRCEPDPSRDWVMDRTRVRALLTTVDDELFANFDAAMDELDDEEARDAAAWRVADVAGDVAAYLQLTGDARSALDLLGRAIVIATDADQQAVLAAAKHDLDAHVTLCHGRWLHAHERFADVERVLRPLAESGKSPALVRAAREVLDAPRPITSAPTLWRLNGCGQALYGNRDAWSDGSFVTTLCVCLLFVPLFPIRAYRVWENNNGYVFRGTVPLSRFAKMARIALLVGVVGVGGVVAYQEHYGSDSYVMGVALDEARALEDAGDYEAAQARYHSIIADYGLELDVSAAALGVVRIAARSVPSPCGVGDVETVGRVVNALYELPEDDRGAAQEELVTRLMTWADEIGEAEPPAARARLALLDMAMPFDTAKVSALRAGTLGRLGDLLAETRPLMALKYYTDITPQSADTLRRAQKIIDGFGESPSLWLEAAPEIEAWLTAASSERGAFTDSPYGQRLADARERDEADQALIEEGDDEKLSAALAAQKDNQALAVAVASGQRQRGELAAAVATLEGVGAPGRMTALTHELLAVCYRDSGRLEDADQLLSPFVEERMAAFQQAQRAYSAAIGATENELIAKLRAGDVPPVLQNQLDGAAGDQARDELVRIWLGEQIAADSQLKALRDDFLKHQGVVSVAITLGMVKLARASEATAGAREALLGEAERSFLSIRAAAEGQPSYHLGLGEVYHRLGKAAEGDAELGGLLAEDDPSLHLAVAGVYRSLGKVARSREISEAVFASGAAPELKYSAAYMLSIIADSLDEKEKWLHAADQTSPAVKAGLIETRGQRAAEAGDLAAADAAYAEVASFWKSQADHSATSTNNEAVAYMGRYDVTGDVVHLRTAATRFEEALRLDPNAALTLSNLLGALQHLGIVKLLSKELKMDVLSPGASDATSLVGLVLDSDRGPALREALAKHPELTRAHELAKQLQVLAPHSDDGYRFELMWHQWRQDSAGIQKLNDRLAAGQKLDVAETARQRRAFERGERDEMFIKAIKPTLKQNALKLERVRATGHQPSIGAAEVLNGSGIISFYAAVEQGSIEDGLEHLRAAYAAWPHEGTRGSLAYGLLRVAVMKARADSPALLGGYTEKRRLLEIETLVEELVRGPNGAEVLAALRRQPELAAAMKLLREGDPPAEASLMFYLAGGWGDDAQVRQRHAGVFDQPRQRLARSIETLLYPGEAREAADLALYDLVAKDPR